MLVFDFLYSQHFNPRPPCGGRPDEIAEKWEKYKAFQSTSPVWRTTYNMSGNLTKGVAISIHVPRVEDDHQSRT